jgi:hypothetical protein
MGDGLTRDWWPGTRRRCAGRRSPVAGRWLRRSLAILVAEERLIVSEQFNTNTIQLWHCYAREPYMWGYDEMMAYMQGLEI